MKEQKTLLSKKNIASLFIIFIMVSSVIGFIWGRNIQKEKYKGYSLIRKGNEWTVKIDDIELGFDYFPTEVEDINLNSEIINMISNTLEVDSTYDTNDSYAVEIALIQHKLSQLLGYKNVYLRRGLTSENEYGLPLIVCENATKQIPVIFFKKSNQTKITLQNNCIIAEARNGIDFIRIKDRLLYGLLKII